MTEPIDLSDQDLLRLAKEQRALLSELRDEVEARGPGDPSFAKGLEAVAVTKEIFDRLHAEMRRRLALYEEVRDLFDAEGSL